MKYKYLIAGITIASDIYFPEMLQTEREPMVEVLYGDVPEHLEENLVDFPVVEANNGQYLLKIPRIGRYLIENGTKVIIQPEKGAALSDVNGYMLTSVLGALSYMSGYVPVHGGAFMVNGKAVLISGPSGAGKSSMLAALHQQGYEILADDISNVKVVDGKAMVYPSYPRLMVWKDAINKLALDDSLAYKVRHDMEKFFIPTGGAFAGDPVEISTIYLLFDRTEEKIPITVKGLAKVNAVKRNLYQPWMINILDTQKECLKQILFLSSHIKMHYFENDRNRNLKNAADAFIETVKKNAE